MANPSPRLFTIPASAPFLPALIAALREGRLVPGFPETADPLALARATIYLPTRRACRLARDMFLDAMGEAAILPRIVPIGDIDEDELAFADAAAGIQTLEIDEALGGLERRLLLAQLIQHWIAQPEMRGAGGAPLVASTPAAALALADTLARLMDDMTTRQVDWKKLDSLVPEDVDTYWQQTLRFLQIARDKWPGVLKAHQRIEPAQRRDLLIAAERKRLEGTRDPVIVAGSTASMPTVAQLIATIAMLPNGSVVLPGLDTDLDEPSWKLIADEQAPAIGHPQFAMQALLKRLGVTREAVQQLVPPAAHHRERLVSEAMRPAAATDLWQERRTDHSAALAGMSVIAAPNADDEALSIAVALRQTSESPGKTAALVTPDRSLARRVIAHLARWNVAVDDSGGDALPDTSAGRFARLVADAAFDGLKPVTLLALLKHPLMRFGASENGHAYAIRMIELLLLRSPRPKRGTTGLREAMTSFHATRGDLHNSDRRKLLPDGALDAAEELIRRFAEALRPLESAAAKPHSFGAIADIHRKVIAALSTGKDGTEAAFTGADGAALDRAFEAIAEASQANTRPIPAADYGELFHTAISDQVVRAREVPSVRIRIYGPLEARLTSADRVVLGSLVESVWPPETRSDPWLSRPMRAQLGLDLPERRISLSAHDFAQTLGASEVILTYAAKLGGAPTVMSRFVQRMAAVAGEAAWKSALERGAQYLQWSRTIDAPPAKPTPVKRPQPKPPLAVRPTQMSVTEIESWLRDPYTIYAKRILRIEPLDAVDTPPGAADRGTVIHGAMQDFTEAFAKALPENAYDELIKCGEASFASLESFPEAKAFWWPRFKRIARWFADWEEKRRATLAALHAEIRGSIEIPTGGAPFKLTARADRIEHHKDGRYAILDYKTGRVPTDKEVMVGLSPQLTLEAAILRGGGFDGIPKGSSVTELVYVGMRGGDPAGHAEAVNFKDSSADAQADRARAKLTSVVQRFADEQQPYLPLVRSMWRMRYGDYDHLARVKEWAAGEEAEDE